MSRHLGASAILLLILCAGGVARLSAGAANTRAQEGSADSGVPSCGELRRRGAEFEPLAQACEYALALPRTLPDLVCTESVKRFLSPQQKKPDTITAELTVEKMHSHYAAVMVNGKPAATGGNAGKPEDELFANLVGPTGDFALLFNVFNGASHTEFTAPVDAVLDHRHVRRYDFRVRRENNLNWTWFFVGASLNPGYHGSLFVDGRTGEVARLVLQVDSTEVDPGTPVSEATTTLDYGGVAISGLGTQHVPLRGENLSCLRGSLGCMRVTLAFSDFHKFGVATRIVP
jgi:hypothetical protein